jgi:chemotaxis protein CheX
MSDEKTDNIRKLPAVADLTFAPVLKQRAEQALAAGTGLVVDASETQRIGTPCLQVLVAATASLDKEGGPTLTITNPSGEFIEAVSTLGLSVSLKVAGA